MYSSGGRPMASFLSLTVALLYSGRPSDSTQFYGWQGIEGQPGSNLLSHDFHMIFPDDHVTKGKSKRMRITCTRFT